MSGNTNSFVNWSAESSGDSSDSPAESPANSPRDETKCCSDKGKCDEIKCNVPSSPKVETKKVDMGIKTLEDAYGFVKVLTSFCPAELKLEITNMKGNLTLCNGCHSGEFTMTITISGKETQVVIYGRIKYGTSKLVTDFGEEVTVKALSDAYERLCEPKLKATTVDQAADVVREVFGTHRTDLTLTATKVVANLTTDRGLTTGKFTVQLDMKYTDSKNKPSDGCDSTLWVYVIYGSGVVRDMVNAPLDKETAKMLLAMAMPKAQHYVVCKVDTLEAATKLCADLKGKPNTLACESYVH